MTFKAPVAVTEGRRHKKEGRDKRSGNLLTKKPTQPAEDIHVRKKETNQRWTGKTSKKSKKERKKERKKKTKKKKERKKEKKIER